MENKKDEVDALFQRTLERANKTADRAALLFSMCCFLFRACFRRN